MATSLRQPVVDALSAIVPSSLRVVPYFRDLDKPTRTTVMVRVDEVRHGSSRGLLDVDVALVVVTGLTRADQVEDELELAVLDLTHAIDSSRAPVSWSKATRSTFADKYHAYEVTATAVVTTNPPE